MTQQWETDAGRWPEAILELRARVEALEAKYETQRLATLGWGADVDKVKRWSDQHLQRIEALEGNRRPASKVYEISEPLQLTPEQAQQVMDLLTLNSKPTPNSSRIRSSLVVRVNDAVNSQVDFSDDALECSRVAIREIAAWLREQQDGDLVAATVLEREAEQ